MVLICVDPEEIVLWWTDQFYDRGLTEVCSLLPCLWAGSRAMQTTAHNRTSVWCQDVLRAYLSQFGPLVEVVVIKDRMTQVSRGYGFATLATKAVCLWVLLLFLPWSHCLALQDTQKVLQKTVHNVGGKEITLKLADVPGYKSGDTSKKIFIGGVNDAHTEGEMTGMFHFCFFGKLIAPVIRCVLSVTQNPSGRRSLNSAK